MSQHQRVVKRDSAVFCLDYSENCYLLLAGSSSSATKSQIALQPQASKDGRRLAHSFLSGLALCQKLLAKFHSVLTRIWGTGHELSLQDPVRKAEAGLAPGGI